MAEKRQRALSVTAANRCENAVGGRCRCRCEGAAHGRALAASDDGLDRTEFERLPADDPHHLPTESEREQAKKPKLPGWEQLSILQA